ncbi:MAG: glycosyltransferase, partial [Candidatus Omnitrophica bacterium]|nr:glycosyltransferase [Candidatus Omnitrophota bacterium]
FEFIVVNDNSTDATNQILKKIKDPRLKIITNKAKLGLTTSLNICLKRSKGEFIARMDADDIARRDRFTKQVNFLDKYKEIGVVGSWVELIDHNGKKRGILKFPLSHQEISKKIFLFNPLRHSTVMFRKELIYKYGFYDEKLDGAEDYDLWLRLGKFTKIANIGLPLLKYRLHDERVSEKEERKVLKAAIMARIKAIRFYNYPFWKLLYLIKPILTYFIPSKVKKVFLKQ